MSQQEAPSGTPELRSRSKNTSVVLIVLAAIAAGVILLIVVGIGLGTRYSKPSDAEVQAALDKGLVIEECQRIAALFGDDDILTSLQKKELWKRYDGKEFTWNLAFVDVQEMPGFGIYNVQFKCEYQGGPLGFTTVTMQYPLRSKAAILDLRKGIKYTIKGKLKSVGGAMSIITIFADPLPLMKSG